MSPCASLTSGTAPVCQGHLIAHREFRASHRQPGTFTAGSTYLLRPAGRSGGFLQVKEIANGASRVQTLPHLGRRTRPQARTNEKTPRRGRSETTRTSDAGFLATRNFRVGRVEPRPSRLCKRGPRYQPLCGLFNFRRGPLAVGDLGLRRVGADVEGEIFVRGGQPVRFFVCSGIRLLCEQSVDNDATRSL